MTKKNKIIDKENDNLLKNEKVKVEKNKVKVEKVKVEKVKVEKVKVEKVKIEEVKAEEIEEEQIEIEDIVTIDSFKSKEILHYKMLEKFFSSTSDEIQTMINIINSNHLISLRFLDWFVTRYCYIYKFSINVNNKYVKENNFNINISYKAQLKSFKKKYFDPFRRKKKFYYTSDKNNSVILTTLGQLNFFRWAITYDIIKYTETNYKTIIEKYNHVNSFFTKNIIDNNTQSTSDETNKAISNDSNDSKKSEEKYNYPQVSRNIFLEF